MKHLLQGIAMLSILCTACGKLLPEEVNCGNPFIKIKPADGTTFHLPISYNAITRATDITGRFKLLHLEAVNDSVKVIVAIKEYVYDNTNLYGDNFHMNGMQVEFRSTVNIAPNFIFLALKENDRYVFKRVDTAMLAITQLDTARKTISGNFYLATRNPTYALAGTFTKVCFLSFK
ncbi:hypothetical protein LX64_05150 [Chitinophaga skermanii]|uniref:Uncharacterized protein n=1 Tax=Chitinophaga skermanii TaxID=331697 RepID=A0A327PZK6_9BACT|nr:hypothetical protein [Chitinophaga skermanii]RAI97479.1 hypothetical protein LX64_05150 [Chitinophaga skermanii]